MSTATNENYMYDSDYTTSNEKTIPLRQSRELGHAVQSQVTIPEPSEITRKNRMGVVLEESHIIGPIVSVPKAETSRTSSSAFVGRDYDNNSTRMFLGELRQGKELGQAVRRTVIIPESSRDQLFNRLGDSIV